MDYLARIRGVIRSFITDKRGFFFVLSHDSVFTSLLNSTLFKQLDIPRNTVFFTNSIEQLQEKITHAAQEGHPTFVFLEQFAFERPHAQYIQKLKDISEQCKILLLSSELERESLTLMIDLGADNAVIKPLSQQNLLEKIANTLEPPHQLGKLIDEARARLALGKPKEAMQFIDQVLNMKPDSATGLMLKGDALDMMGDERGAIAQYTAASNTSAMFLSPLKRLATLYAQKKDTKEELRFLAKLDRLSPLNYERKIDMGRAHLQLGETPEGNEKLSEALSLAEKGDTKLLGDVALKLAESCMDEYPEVCEEHLRSMLENPDAVPARAAIAVWNRLGIALRRQGKWAEAVVEYRKAITRDPDDENLHFNVAMALAEGKRFDEASNELDSVLQINASFGKSDPALAASTGRIYQLAGKNHQALRFFEYCLSEQPGNKAVARWLEELTKAI